MSARRIEIGDGRPEPDRGGTRRFDPRQGSGVAKRIGEGPLDYLTSAYMPDTRREMTPTESKRYWARLFGEVYMSEDTRGHYLRWLAWRVTRELATYQGLIGPDDTLASIGAPAAGSAWYQGAAMTACKDEMANESVPYEMWSLHALALFGAGLPLTPSQATQERFAEMVRKMATEVRLVNGAPRMPGAWHHAIDHIKDDAHLRNAWPCPTDVLSFEEDVLLQAHHLTVNATKHEAIEELHALLGVNRYQATGLIRAAVGMFARMSFDDLEDKRYVMERRLEAVMGRAQEAADLDTELKALKQLGAVQGLTRTEPTTAMDEIMRTIGAVAAGAQKVQLPAPLPTPEPPKLPPRRIEVAQPETDDE